MAENTLRNAPPLYDRDVHAWAQQQTRAITERRLADIDWANVAEEIESVGNSQKSEIRNRLRILLLHLAKWEFQPEKRKAGWIGSIGEARSRIAGVIDDSPSLRRLPADRLDWSWKRARLQAAEDMRRPLDSLPEDCPYTVEQALDDTFFPGEPRCEDLPD